MKNQPQHSRRMLLIAACLMLFAQPAISQFWQTPGSSNTTVTIARQGRVGVGIPSSGFSSFNASSGRYSVANRVGFLVQGSSFTNVSNIGHLLTGDYGQESTGDVWTSIGGPGSPGISGLPIYGTRHQFDVYSVNMALADRNILSGTSGSSGIRDAIIFYDAGPGNNSRMLIGKTQGAGQIRPDVVINANGNIGIGTTSSNVGSGNSAKLKVQGSTANKDLTLYVQDKNATSSTVPSYALGVGPSSAPAIYLGYSTSSSFIASNDDPLKLGREESGSFNEILTITRSISSDVVVIDGDLWPNFGINADIGNSGSRAWNDVFADNFINISDARSKEKVEPLPYGLEHIKQLNPVTFQWKDKPQEGLHSGLLAQEVQKVIPEVVYDPNKDIRYDKEGRALTPEKDARYGIRYQELIPVLIRAMQEMSETIEGLESRLATYETAGKSERNANNLLETGAERSSLLFQNSPNPYSQRTEITFYLSEQVTEASLLIFDMNGRQLDNIGINSRGDSGITIDGNRFQPGMYIYTLIADGREVDSKRMILVK
ncbi:tail fiber domain-containing protein [Roseivirga sp. BDSF3-8]|uniref:tail fiber domain-containing protein n=1 Tax=Roseivirga sp. BDSF3-8 TaxID=3241598 RepID=UPI0035327DD7